MEKLQEQNQETIDALKELQQVIPELWENDQVLFTFIDLPNAYKQFRGLKDGDLILIIIKLAMWWSCLKITATIGTKIPREQINK